MQLRHIGRHTGGVLIVMALLGCDDRMGDYPALMPTDQLLAEPHIPAHAGDQSTDQAGAQLTARAAGLARGPSGLAPTGDLMRRADALRARADTLRQTSLDACTEDRPDCAQPTTNAATPNAATAPAN